jgi:hypothetical protein
MVNGVYDTGRAAFLNAGINWTSDNIKAVLINTASYTVNLSTHAFLSDIAAGARAATSANLTTKTSTAGVADAADITFSAVPTGPACGAYVLYKDTTVATTSQLICYVDTVASGLPVTPNGGDITVTFDNGTNKIFKL